MLSKPLACQPHSGVHRSKRRDDRVTAVLLRRRGCKTNVRVFVIRRRVRHVRVLSFGGGQLEQQECYA